MGGAGGARAFSSEFCRIYLFIFSWETEINELLLQLRHVCAQLQGQLAVRLGILRHNDLLDETILKNTFKLIDSVCFSFSLNNSITGGNLIYYTFV